jgi:hypothetical protein
VKVEIGGRTVRLPDFLIVGAARSGTTSLFRYLKQHPDIFIPEIKESYFFAYADKETHFTQHKIPVIWDFHNYVNLFGAANRNHTLGEVSASYLYLYKPTIENIRKYMPLWQKLKIVAILRNPIERAFSMYSAFITWEEESLSFEQALKAAPERLRRSWHPEYDYLGYGLYYEQVKAFLYNFPATRIYLYEDLVENADSLMKNLCDFLKIDRNAVLDIRDRHNASIMPYSLSIKNTLRKPDLVSSSFPLVKLIPLNKRIAFIRKLQELNIRKNKHIKRRTIRHLKEFYREDILKLQDLIGRNLSAWLK